MPKERETKILQAQAIDLLHRGRFSETKGWFWMGFFVSAYMAQICAAYVRCWTGLL